MTEKFTKPGAEGYPFPVPELRAVCLRVVDGDTLELLVDRGFHDYSVDRFRILGVNTPELRSSDPVERERADAARQQVALWTGSGMPDFPPRHWDVLIRARKDPDSFGRWLADVWALQPDGQEIAIGPTLIERGLGVPYRR